jgi:phosphonate transport system substrate-binding protein
MTPQMQSLRRSRPAIAILLAAMTLMHAVAVRAESVLTLGRISDDPKSHYVQLKPLLDYLVPRMGDVGIREGRILMARDLRQMSNHLRHGRVDWITETPGMALQLEAIAGARLLLLTERGGVREYRSCIIARRDSGIRALPDLAGRTIAFEHPASTSAYLVPAVELLMGDLSLEPMTALGDIPTSDAVGYLFARSEANIAIWVDKGLIASGVVSNLGWQNPRSIPEAMQSRLAIIHESEPFPRGLELIRQGLDPHVGERLRQLLIDASSDPQAVDALRAFFNTTAFLPIDLDVERRLQTLRAGMARVRVEVE